MRWPYFSVIAAAALSAACVFAAACSAPPIEPRSVIPADALVYLETEDLGAAISAITENPKFSEISTSVPNLETLNGIKVSVAVTDLETKETKTDGGSVLDLRPHFVAVAETNAWNFQARGFVEERLDELVKHSYGDKTKLNRVGKYGGDLYEWVAPDGRRSYALVIGSAVYFSNDIAAIEKCLAVGRGEQASIAKRPEILDVEHEGVLASGFLTEDRIAQIANLVGVSAAMNSGDDAGIQSFVARVLPQALRGIAGGITWSAKRTDNGIEDEYRIKLKGDAAEKTADAFSPIASGTDLSAFVPKDALGVTRYDLADPKKAWNTALEITRENVDPLSADLIRIFSASLFEPYGVGDPENFLENIDGSIVTAKLSDEGDEAVVIAAVKDIEAVKEALSRDLPFSRPPEKLRDADLWQDETGDLAAAFVGNIVIAGSSDAVKKCLEAKRSGENISSLPRFERFRTNGASAVTITDITDPELKIFDAFGGAKPGVAPPAMFSLTLTSYDASGIKRSVVSDFGLLGSLIERLTDEP